MKIIKLKSHDVIKPHHAGWSSIFDVEIIDDLESQELNEIKIESNIDINEKSYFATDEIIWNDAYRVNAAKYKIIIGMIGNFQRSIENEKINELATIGILSLDNKILENLKKILLAIAGKIKNTNQKWNKEKTSTGRNDEGCNWGNELVLAQFIEFEAKLILPENNKYYT